MPKKHLLIKNIGDEGINFVAQYYTIQDAMILATQNVFNIESIEKKQDTFINIERINDVKKINIYLKKSK